MELGCCLFTWALCFPIQPSLILHLALSSQPHIYVTCLAHVSTAGVATPELEDRFLELLLRN